MVIKECIWKPIPPTPYAVPAYTHYPIHAIQEAFAGEELASTDNDKGNGLRYMVSRGVSYISYHGPRTNRTVVEHWFVGDILSRVKNSRVEALLAQLEENRMEEKIGWDCLCADHYRIYFRLENTIDDKLQGTAYFEDPLCPGSMVTIHDVCRGARVADVFSVISGGDAVQGDECLSAMRWTAVVGPSGLKGYQVSFGQAYTVAWACSIQAKVEDTDWFRRNDKVVHLVAGKLVCGPSLPFYTQPLPLAG